MEVLFALILQSCLIGDDGNARCEDFQVHLYSTMQDCNHGMTLEKKYLEEFDTLRCTKVQYKK